MPQTNVPSLVQPKPTPSPEVQSFPETSKRQTQDARRSYRRKRRSKTLAAALVLSLIALLLSILISTLYVSRASNEIDGTLLQARKLERDLELAQEQLAKMRQDLAVLVQKRIPQLRPMVFDEAVPASESFVRNIIFTLVGVGEKRTIEYRTVVSNDSLSEVKPHIRIMLFDEVGIQIGSADIKDAGVPEAISLDPGETRSYSAAIEFDTDAQPHYFMLAVKEPEAFLPGLRQD